MIGNRLSMVLLVLVAALAALLGWQLRGGLRSDAPLAALPTPVAVALPTNAPALQSVPPLDELTQTLERPLFVRSRRPPPLDSVVEVVPDDVPDEPAPTAMTIELSAVVLESERQYALFRQATQAGLLKVELGQEVEGWKVGEIRADGVRLERGTQSQELPLRTFKAPVLSAPARATSGRRPKASKTGPSPAARKRRPRRPLRGPRQRSVVRQ